MQFYFNDSIGCLSIIIVLIIVFMLLFSIGKAILFSPIGIILILFLIWRNFFKSVNKKKNESSKVDIKWQEKSDKGINEEEFWDDDEKVVEVEYEEIDK